jgi:hypothetical protein
MSLQRRFRIGLLATTLLSMTAFGAAEQSGGLLVLAVMGTAAGWWVNEAGGIARWNGLPRWLSTLALLVMLAVAVARSLQGPREVVSAFTGFLASIVLVKMWERRELRDYAQLLTMSLFLAVGATLDTNSLLIGVLLMLLAPVLMVTVMLFQVYAAGERVREVAWRGTGAMSEAPAPLAEGAAFPPAFTRVAITTGVAAGLISAVVFVLVPRGIGGGEWGDFARARGQQTTGFTEEVEPGAGDVISVSQVAVMEVEFRDRDRNPLGGPDQVQYLRGSVLDHYDAMRGRWTRSAGREGGIQIKSTDSFQELKLTDKPLRGHIVTQSVTELAGVRGDTPVFALYKPVSLTLHRVEQAEDITFDEAAGWVVRHGDGLRVAYEVTSIIDPASAEQPSGSEAPERSGDVSFPSPDVQSLAVDLLRRSGFEPDPMKRPLAEDGRASRVFETYLRTNCEYTLSSGPAPAGRSPTEYFLFESRRGHCEYFASALAALCRSVGIDARVVAGYLVSEYHADHAAYTVRASDAHAWVEVDTGPGGWQRRDATPAEGLREIKDSRRTLWAKVQRLGAAVQDLWNSAVVTFDQGVQDKLLARVGGGSQRGYAESAAGALRRFVARLRAHADLRAGWAARAMVVGAVLLVMGLVWASWRAVKRRNTRLKDGDGWAMGGQAGPVHRELMALLKQRGHPKPSWRPPMDHVQSVRAKDAWFAGAAAEVVELLYRARFGGGGGDSLAAARVRLGELRRALRPRNESGKR